MSDLAHLSDPVGPDDHSHGPSNAPITLVEYGDYECPYCGAAYLIVEELLQDFGDSLRFVFRNLPLADAHPHAEKAAEMAEAVGMQGMFWEMHDVLYENQRKLSDEALESYATRVGADLEQVRKDLDGGEPERRVEADFESAIRSGANGTPTFFVNGIRYDGSWQYEEFADYLQKVLDQ